MNKQFSLIAGLLSLIILVLTGCTGQAPAVASASVVEALQQGEGDFAKAMAPRPFAFPLDHGPHPDYRTEWWYYTGNLADEQGGQYGFQLTFFRSALAAEQPARTSDLATNQLYMAHFALTSQPADQHVSFERFSRGAGELAGAVGDPQFGVWLEDWAVEQIDATSYHLEATTPTDEGKMALQLTLRDTRPPLLHGDAGLSQKGSEPGNANYYYSLVGLESSGELTFAGETVAVSGTSWVDHEFGTSSLSGNTNGWDWFAVQLDNGMALMFGEFHNREGGERSVYGGTLGYPDGQQIPLGEGAFELTATGEWTSPVTGIKYPAGWRVRFPAQAIELTITPIVDDQEMDVSFIYYEGATQVEATVDGETVSGRGFVELTGYGENTGYQR